jgi:hypothetical protein
VVKESENQQRSKFIGNTKEGETQPVSSSTKENHFRSQGSIPNSSKPVQKKANKKVEYYGVHEEDMVKQTHKDIIKMRSFIEDHTTMLDPSQDLELVDKF